MPLKLLVSGAPAPSAGHEPKSLRWIQPQNLELQVSPGESRPTSPPSAALPEHPAQASRPVSREAETLL